MSIHLGLSVRALVSSPSGLVDAINGERTPIIKAIINPPIKSFLFLRSHFEAVSIVSDSKLSVLMFLRLFHASKSGLTLSIDAITITVIMASNIPIIACKPPMYKSPNPSGNVPASHSSMDARTAAENIATHEAIPIDHNLLLPKIPNPLVLQFHSFEDCKVF